MDIVSLCQMIEDITTHKIYPIQFPDITGTIAKLEITTGMVETGGIYDFNIEISVKSEHPSECERICLDLINKLHKKYHVEHNGYQLVLCQAEKPYPFYLGNMENGESVFSCNFRMLTSKL